MVRKSRWKPLIDEDFDRILEEMPNEFTARKMCYALGCESNAIERSVVRKIAWYLKRKSERGEIIVKKSEDNTKTYIKFSSGSHLKSQLHFIYK